MVLKPWHLATVIIIKLIICPIIGIAINALLMIIVPDIYAPNYPLFFTIFLFWAAPSGVILLNVFLLAKVYIK